MNEANQPNDDLRELLEKVQSGELDPGAAAQALTAQREADPPEEDVTTQTAVSETEHAARAEASPPKTRRLTPDELIELRIHGVDANFMREMRDLGLGDLSLQEFKEMAIHGVDADFVHEMRELGYRELPVSNLLELRIHGVDADFVRQMRDLGFEELPLDKLVEMRIHGVDADFVREMRDLGF